jgi:magnesium transporter
LITLTILKPSGSGSLAEALKEFPAKIGEGELLWVDAEAPSDEELMALKERFDLDSYAVEDVTHKDQRPKIESYGGYVFAVVHIPTLKRQGNRRRSEMFELFVFFGRDWIITIHPSDCELIHDVERRVRERGLSPLAALPSPDLLFYVFLDFGVDAYYPILDETDDRLEELDRRASASLEPRSNATDLLAEVMPIVGSVRRELTVLRRSLTPTRDMIGMVMRGAVPFVADSSLRSFRDVYDHSFQLLETIDNDRERTSDVRDLCLSLLTASTNNIIKRLTIIATVFLPLTLLAGIYGTNFTPGFFAPGSSSPLGFYALILAMVVLALLLVYYFKRSGWI